jgi:subtilisin family serine protease
LLCLTFLLILPAASWATEYRAWTWYQGHPAAADNCIVEFQPTAALAEIVPALVDAGFALQSVSLPDGTVVVSAELKAVADFQGEDLVLGVVTLDSRAGLEAQMRRLAKVPGVRGAFPNWIHHALWTPNDPYYGSYQGNFKQIYMPTAWDLTKGAGATVAVIDSGYVKSGLEDRAKNVLDGYDFWGNDSNVNDYIGHGTHVSNTIAENTDNGKGCAGIAFNGTIMPLKVFPDYDGGAQESDIISAINYAVSHGADVINMSLGGGGYYGGTDNAIDNAVDNDVVVVAASGNSGGGTVEYPGAYANCIAVGATNQHSVGGTPSRASFSNYGSALDLSAPGVDIVQETRDPYYGIDYFSASGTSMSSPHVAGVAALLVSYGGADALGIRQALYQTAHNPAGDWTSSLGWGEVDAHAALVEYGGANQPPVADAAANPTSGYAPLNVNFYGGGSSDPDGNITQYLWRLQSTNQLIGSQVNTSYTFTTAGTYVVVLEVTDNAGATDTDTVTITVKTGGGDDDTDDFGDDPCGLLLETVYNDCDFSLVWSNGQRIDGQTAYEMCLDENPPDVWECLQMCRDNVENCRQWRRCAEQECEADVKTKPKDNKNDDSGWLWGCG